MVRAEQSSAASHADVWPARRPTQLRRQMNYAGLDDLRARSRRAHAGIDMFRFPELRHTFCPTKEEYFERDPERNVLRPRANVFTGFDQCLDYGRIVGLEMPKSVYFDAAVCIQVALKAQ